MIKGKGKIVKIDGRIISQDLENALNNLPDGDDYLFVICDETKNRNLPFLTYYFSVVIRYLSAALPDHPHPTALYKFFEDMFAPIHTSTINGEQFEYCELKSERVRDVNDVIEKVVEYALNKWGIEIPRQGLMNDPRMREFYSQAYLNQDADWSSFISSHKKLSKDERRSKENECV